MNISNYYWYFTSAIPPKLCDDIINYSLSKKETMALTGGYEDKKLSKEEVRNMQMKRKSDLVWLDETWIYRELTDGSEYEGGELEFDFRNYDPHIRDELKHLKQAKEILPKGSIVVFPSFVWHRVKPVTKGTRYSLVMWNLGYPFK